MSATDSPLARAAARLLAQQAGHPEGPRALGDRAATVAALEAVLRNRRRQRTVRAVGFGAAAAAVVMIVSWQLGRAPGLQHAPTAQPPTAQPLTAMAISLPDESATLARAGLAVSLGSQRGSMGLLAGDRLRTGRRGRVAVALSSGTRLDLGADGDLELSELGAAQRFVLRGGSVRARVAKLASGHRFLISTPDSEVEVRGTSFEVVLVSAEEACPELVTEVRVREGLVVVRGQDGEQELGAGSTWQSPCARNAPASLPPPVTPEPRSRRVRPAVDLDLSASTLRDQNDLFGAALEARRRGDKATALRLIDSLLRRYPDSPLAESARTERQELAGSAGP